MLQGIICYSMTSYPQCELMVILSTDSSLEDVELTFLGCTVKTCFKRLLKKKTKIGFQDRLLLNVDQKYCRMLQESILQYFRPLLSYYLSLRPLFCVILSGILRQVLLYSKLSKDEIPHYLDLHFSLNMASEKGIEVYGS